MGNFFIVGIGGFLGTVARYGVYLWIGPMRYPGRWPMATFAVNLAGSFLIGLLMGWFMRTDSSLTTRVLWVTGFCGGFTTFSTFSMDSFVLFRDGHHALALGYILASVVLCISGVWGGMTLAVRN